MRNDKPVGNDSQPIGASSNGAWQQNVDLFTVLGVVLRHRRMILRNVACAAGLFIILALIWPPRYEARTTLLPPEAKDQDGLFNSLSGQPLVNFAFSSPRSASDLFVEILTSRAVGEGVLRHPLRIDSTETTLTKLWGLSSSEKALKRLYANTTLSTSEQGMIEIAVEMNSPELAAAVANAFVAELDRVNKQKSVSTARNSRQYIESQLQRTSKNLRQLADSLSHFQKQYGTVGLDEQMRALLEQTGALKGKLIARQIELEMLRRNLRPNSPELVQLQAEIAALEKQYRNLQYGDAEGRGDRADYLIPFADMPDLARQLAELTRELKAQESIWQLLNQQYYQARIQEARDTPTIQVLDPAVPPEFRSKPRRMLMVLIGAGSIFIFSLCAAFVMSYLESVRHNEHERSKWRALLNDFDGTQDGSKQYKKTVEEPQKR